MSYLELAKQVVRNASTTYVKNVESSLVGEKVNKAGRVSFIDPYFKGYWEMHVPREQWPQWKLELEASDV